MTDRHFSLPDAVADLVAARNKLRDHYRDAGLQFTLDGKLVGDIGEAVAAELFGLQLAQSEGIDGFSPNGSTVQVKATGVGGGAQFRFVEKRSEMFIFLDFDFDSCSGEVVYNGPEVLVLKYLPEHWVGQREVSIAKIRKADAQVDPVDRLQRVR